MRQEPFFFEYSKIPVWLSKFAPITISAITLGPFVFSRGKLSDKTKRHETIHYQQYLETLFIGFILVYIYDFLYAAIIAKKGFSRDSYLAIRFEQEAWSNHHDVDYLKSRSKYAWLNYKIK